MPSQRVGVRVSRIERMVRVIVKVDVAVGARKDRLVFAAALRVEARLEVCGPMILETLSMKLKVWFWLMNGSPLKFVNGKGLIGECRRKRKFGT